jgi:hypothetical protein
MDEGAQQPYLGNDLFLQNALKGLPSVDAGELQARPLQIRCLLFQRSSQLTIRHTPTIFKGIRNHPLIALQHATRSTASRQRLRAICLTASPKNAIIVKRCPDGERIREYIITVVYNLPRCTFPVSSMGAASLALIRSVGQAPESVGSFARHRGVKSPVERKIHRAVSSRDGSNRRLARVEQTPAAKRTGAPTPTRRRRRRQRVRSKTAEFVFLGKNKVAERGRLRSFPRGGAREPQCSGLLISARLTKPLRSLFYRRELRKRRPFLLRPAGSYDMVRPASNGRALKSSCLAVSNDDIVRSCGAAKEKAQRGSR